MNLVAALLMLMAVSTGASLVLAMIFGTLTLWIAWVSLWAGIGIAAVVFIRCRHLKSDEPGPTKFDWVMGFLFILFCLRQFLWVYFRRGAEMWTLNWRHGFSDLAMHLTYIANIANGMRFWPDNPLFVGEKLTYHFGIDLFSAIFSKIGVPLHHSLPLIGVTAGILTLFAL
ncbi:MAG: hypothetical protein NC930_09160, partial [Candidatus Omnitrophica bacterium]|nr:hypothetical protein [Candidatus Omnitrophota bacterium]